MQGNTEFWRRKMRTLHSLLDVNNDGVISYDDFRLLADKFTALGHLKTEAHDEFLQVLQQTWEEQWGEITPYNLISAEQYLTEMHHYINDQELRNKVHLWLPYLFKVNYSPSQSIAIPILLMTLFPYNSQAVDKDHSGFISLKEYKLFFNCLGLTPEDAAVSFAIIDKNGDGKLSIKEFVKLGREYFLTEDERKVSRMFWGPLLEHWHGALFFYFTISIRISYFYISLIFVRLFFVYCERESCEFLSKLRYYFSNKPNITCFYETFKYSINICHIKFNNGIVMCWRFEVLYSIFEDL